MATAEPLIDTDVFVDHIRGVRALDVPAGSSYSMVTRAELFAGRPDEERAVTALLAPLVERPVSRALAEEAGRIRRRSGLALPDALIAATALEHGSPLMTRNRRHFERVGGLEIVTPA